MSEGYDTPSAPRRTELDSTIDPVYSDVPASIDAAADVLAGRTSAPGRLPVPVQVVGACPSS